MIAFLLVMLGSHVSAADSSRAMALARERHRQLPGVTFTLSFRRRPALRAPLPSPPPPPSSSPEFKLRLWSFYTANLNFFLHLYQCLPSWPRRFRICHLWRWGRGCGATIDRLTSLTAEQRELVAALSAELDEDERQCGLHRRARAVGFELTDLQLVRYFRTSDWAVAFPDGNTVRAVIECSFKDY